MPEGTAGGGAWGTGRSRRRKKRKRDVRPEFAPFIPPCVCTYGRRTHCTCTVALGSERDEMPTIVAVILTGDFVRNRRASVLSSFLLLHPPIALSLSKESAMRKKSAS